MYKLLFIFLSLWLFSQQAAGAVGFLPPPEGHASSHRTDSVDVPIYFRFDDTMVLRDFKNNDAGFLRIDSLMKEINRVDSVVIIGSTSPDGWSVYNLTLAQRRAEAMRGYFYWRYPAAQSVPVRLRVDSDMIGALVDYIGRDNNVPRREKVLEVLSDESRSLDTRIANLKLVSGGAYEYLEREIFPKMRMAVSYIVYYKTPADAKEAIAATEESEMEVVDRNPVSHQESAAESAATPTTTTEGISSAPLNTVTTPIAYTSKPLFALKTNLLFDALTAINFEIEVPIGKRWSVAGELIFPWWLNKSKQRCFQLINGNIEGRYWFGNRAKRPVMTGWFGGLYAGGGYYDLEWDAKGYQGEFFIAAGLSGGYAHTINKKGNLRMEYSLGVGFMQTHYREYAPQQGGDVLMWQRDGKFTWFGPTRAKISLVWLLNKKGGVK